MTERLLTRSTAGSIISACLRGLGKYLMPQLRVTGLALPIAPLVQGNGELAKRLYRNRFTLAGAEVSGGTGSIFAAALRARPGLRSCMVSPGSPTSPPADSKCIAPSPGR